MNHGLCITNHDFETWIIDHASQIMDYASWIMDHASQIMDYESWIMDHASQIILWIRNHEAPWQWITDDAPWIIEHESCIMETVDVCFDLWKVFVPRTTVASHTTVWKSSKMQLWQIGKSMKRLWMPMSKRWKNTRKGKSASTSCIVWPLLRRTWTPTCQRQFPSWPSQERTSENWSSTTWNATDLSTGKVLSPGGWIALGEVGQEHPNPETWLL